MPSWSNKPSGTMTAAVLTPPGAHPPTACFTINHTYPKPTLPSEDWVLARVRAAGLNRAELRGRNGDAPAPAEFGIFTSEYHEDPPKVEQYAPHTFNPPPFSQLQTIPTRATSPTHHPPRSQAKNPSAASKPPAPPPPSTPATPSPAGSTAAAKPTPVRPLPLAALLLHPAHPPALGRPRRHLPEHVDGMGLPLRRRGAEPGARPSWRHGGTSSVGLWAILLATDHQCTLTATTRQGEKIAKLQDAGAHHVLLEPDPDARLRPLVPEGLDRILEPVAPDRILHVALPATAPPSRRACRPRRGAWTHFAPSDIPAEAETDVLRYGGGGTSGRSRRRG
ncbi:hypothetical protein HO173_011855 [Letharia columbiana]|uniref:Uncharacterized protein n=1 Tax=Letharia columbiana TaxID=112416 RepID=A0A8H6CS42_9LECA|nr:uncharacterized protein HO173_011855 [Letharia columbiana]KAF6228553.1 hypothetical protein HO173_011855 [Letharia columbiana]